MAAHSTRPNTDNGLWAFLAPVRDWFVGTFGEPTPPQAAGWPAIQRGEHTLILSPTGSGKTLAAFLWGIDRLFRELATTSVDVGHDQAREPSPGVRLVYVSPLKALNNDIHRNLRSPLAGIRRLADAQGLELPPIRVAVRSGDTPQRERRAMVKTPPHILITTPESLYLLLTSPKAREMFRPVRTVIVDEIHTLAGNKRGVHFALSLERLQALADQPIQRLGLSATIRPLEEVARFLGGSEWQGSGTARTLEPRPVTVVDAAYEKELDLQVITVVDDFRNLPGDSIWPTLIPEVLRLVRSHHTTLIFANNRRLAERTADRLNEQWAAEAAGHASGLIEDGVAKGVGFLAAGRGETTPIGVHHGSIAKEARLLLEQQLKAGELPALVGTSSLELGIDIGDIDLVVQLQSPKSVAQGLQRVGRSGHLVGQTSKGRIFPTHREDVVEAAAIAGGMLRGEVEPTITPRQPVDVLAQQIVAMVAVQNWEVDALFDLVRRAYAYRDLTYRVFMATLEMLSGRYASQPYRELRPRLALDRVNHKLAALPGSRWLALTNGGTIPDTGAFSAYLSDRKTKLGELDEEFVFETRVGDALMLGSQVWRVIDLTEDRVIVAEAPGAVPRMPFWRGEYPWRPYELGRRVGAFRRSVVDQLVRLRATLHLTELREIRTMREAPEVQALVVWLGEAYALDPRSAWHTLDYLAGQLDQAGAVASDRTVLVEVFDDALGDPRLVLHSPFGGRVNGPWGLALASALRERAGIEVEVETNDDGILFRLLDAGQDFPLDVVTALTPSEARERILRELPDSAVFGARFRQNAARALLLPGVGRGKRTPFWLQRLRARDLLQVARQLDDFPIVAETYRDCLQDVLDLPHLEEVLTAIQEGKIQVVPVASLTPSPVAQSLLWDFVNVHMYEWDTPRAEQQLQMLAVNRDLLQDLLKDVALEELLRPEAIDAVRARLQHTATTSWARTAEELAVLLDQLGDLSSAEIAQRTSVDPADWIARLTGEGRVMGMELPTSQGPVHRWVPAEYVADYRAAFGLADGVESVVWDTDAVDEARRRILARYLGYAGPVTLEEIRTRYDFPVAWLNRELERLVAERALAHGRFTPREDAVASDTSRAAPEYVDRHALEQIHRRTLQLLRNEVQPVPFTVYAQFLVNWQHLTPSLRLTGDGSLVKLLQQLRAAPVVGRVWERDVLSLRLGTYDAGELDALCQSGEVVWVASGEVDPRYARVRFLFRGEGAAYLGPAPETLADLGANAQEVYDFLRSEGAVFFADICAALDLEASTAETALIALVLGGLVTNDSLAAMRTIVESRADQPDAAAPLSSLEEELGRRREQLGLGTRRVGHKPERARYRSARRRVRQRLAQQSQPCWTGRWTPVYRFGVLGKEIPLADQAARHARQLLMRYGVVTHAALNDEIGAWDWGLIYQELKRLEMRGEVRRGYFVRDLPGAQFALPEVVDRLRALRDAASAAEELVVMNACDPANLYGPSRALTVSDHGAPIEFTRLPSTWLVQHRGLPILVASAGGVQMVTNPAADGMLLTAALRMLLDHLGSFESRVTVEMWNGQPVLDCEDLAVLEAAGFYRNYPGMTWGH